MSKVIEKTYNLKLKRPKVLLVGNGLFRDKGFDWTNFIKNVSDKNMDSYFKNGEKCVPYYILASVGTSQDDIERYNNYEKLFKESKYDTNELAKEIVTLNLDAILTTNYTYELELALKSNFRSINDKRRYARSIRSDSKYLIHTYNQITKDAPKIFHIHGEERNKSSIILTHNEYVRLLGKILEYSNNRKNEYEEFFEDFKIKSWIDYFIIADIYVIGFGFDFSEYDLWWMLSRRNREKNKGVQGSIVFYEPIEKKSVHKKNALRDYGVLVETLGIEIDESKSKEEIANQYKAFYLKAINEIKSK